MIFKIYDDPATNNEVKPTIANVINKEEKPKSNNKIFLFSILAIIILSASFVYFVFFSSTSQREIRPTITSKTPEATKENRTPEKTLTAEVTMTPVEKKSSVQSISISVEDSNALIVKFKLLDYSGAEAVEDGVVTIEVRNFFDKLLYTKTFYAETKEFKDTQYEIQINKSDINKSIDSRGYVIVEFNAQDGKKVLSSANYNKLEKTNSVKEFLDIENYSCEPEKIEGIYSNASTNGITIIVRFLKSSTFVAAAGILETKISNSNGAIIFEDRREIKPKDFVFTNPYLGEAISYYFSANYSDMNLTPKSGQTISYEKCTLAVSFVTTGGKKLQKETSIQLPTR
ncbi:MAG: hypothetical protein N3F05_00510 [Candidatus Diapherotrites archaeon]|nr:hypothetical protein [Candidatus Diapherotrites archaeon]